jgi:hypothetical protein
LHDRRPGVLQHRNECEDTDGEQEPIGVCKRGFTLRSKLEPGSCSSRAMPKHSRIVEAWIARQQTKIAAATTSKYTVANAVEKFASMICAGPNAP